MSEVTPNDESRRTGIEDCWNRIGVRGNRSCPKLLFVTHCRNCPVHADAARQVLQNASPIEYLHASTRHYASTQAIESAGSCSALLFRIGSEWLGLPTPLIDEVGEIRTIHTLPHRRDTSLLGLTNVRGELIASTSLAHLLHIPDDRSLNAIPSRTAPARLLVLRSPGQARIACPVDEVHGVQRFHERELQAPPATLSMAVRRFTRALLPWNSRHAGLLDDGALVQSLMESMT